MQRTRCATGEACTVVGGVAACRLVGECREGDARCATAGFQVCTAGAWTTKACAGTCVQTAYGATCSAVATATLTATFSFEGKLPNADYTDWGAPQVWVDSGFLVVSLHDGKVIDATSTKADGTFSIKVASPQVDSDVIAVLTAGVEGNSIGFVVANPGFASGGEQQPGKVGDKPSVWGWASTVGALSVAPHELRAHVAEGSAAAWVFSYINGAWASRRDFYGRPPRTLAVWLAPDVTWSCGACAWNTSTTVSNLSFQSQIVLPGGANEGFWSGAVILHEFGHVVMSSYGVPAVEGGMHILGVPTFPGQAWSEGWATYHQADVLNQPWYFDKQGGGMFYLSLDHRSYSGPAAWKRPVAANGLKQLVDENEVAAMLWSLRGSSTDAPGAILNALASPRMTTSPFLRGYTRHTWSVTRSGVFSNVADTGQSAPFFADMLDALVCAGFSRAAIDAATEPTTHFPYPSQSPLCR